MISQNASESSSLVKTDNPSKESGIMPDAEQ